VRNALLIGAYGGEHAGDAAILGGVIRRLLDRHPIERLAVASNRPDRTRRWLAGLDLERPVEVVASRRPALRQAVARTDLVVHAGGPLMDLPGPLVAHLEVVSRARRSGLAFEIEGSGIGPFKLAASRFVARRLIACATRICLRSAGAARHPLVAGRAVAVDRDPALDYLADREVLTKLAPHEVAALDALLDGAAGPRIGINLRPLWHKYGATADRRAAVQAELLDRVAQGMRLASQDGGTWPRFVFFPMNADQYGGSDLDMASALAERLAGAPVDFAVFETEPGPDALVALLRRLDGVIAMRFHAVLFALSQQLPVVGLDYSLGEPGKVDELFRELGRPGRVCNIRSLTPEFFAAQVAAFGADPERRARGTPAAPRKTPR
jgi:polysaccharide pyruvyl transferase WcaK-like protein